MLFLSLSVSLSLVSMERYTTTVHYCEDILAIFAGVSRATAVVLLFFVEFALRFAVLACFVRLRFRRINSVVEIQQVLKCSLFLLLFCCGLVF